ncbi:hypothetical protein NNA34_12275 [Lacticaseibacillus paracasei]|uniref:hypothetical protein n=1 Tax=Lacticaseibacillus paracasei TaxID=1597 RepID=UPI002874404A|nr:hypothetical protein [Lacticaseibacillus paracasei]MDS0491053.1 hypothetical protein [Lacticaseibacillus paracasei]
MEDTQKSVWETYLTQRNFEFGQQGKQPYTQQMILAPDGRITNYGSNNEKFWQIKDNQLEFLDINRQLTTSFVLPESPAKLEHFTLTGTYVLNSSVKHQLRARSLPQDLHTMRDDLEQSLTDRFLQASSPTFPRSRKIKTHSHIRVAFILNSVETLPALMPLIQAVKKDAMFEAKILVLNRMYTSADYGYFLSTRSKVEAFLTRAGLNFISLDDDDDSALDNLKLWQADFIVRQSEWDNDYPDQFIGERLDWARLIHIPYTITEKMIYPVGHKTGSLLTNEYYLHVWRYFTEEPLGPNEKEAIEKSFVSRDIFQSVGSMKAKMIQHAAPNWPIHHGGKRVLWTAHHSVTKRWLNFGMFPQIYQSMLAWTQAHQELSVLFNPHPLLREIIRTEDVPGLSLAQYDAFLKEFASLPNGGVLQNTSQYGASAAADVVLTDGSSAFYEMQIQRKPIVALLRSDHVAFTPEGEKILKGVHVKTDIDHALRTVSQLLREPDNKLNNQIETTKTWLANDHPEFAIMQAMRGEMGL